MKRQTYLYISGSIFGIVAILHLIRAVLQLPVQLGTFSFPVGLSWFGGVVAFFLCAWSFRLAGREGRGCDCRPPENWRGLTDATLAMTY